MGRSTPTQITSSYREIVTRGADIKNKFFPKSGKAAYVILDLETTGLDCNKDWPIEVAALFVTGVNGEYHAQHSFHSYFNWAESGLVDTNVFRERLDKTNEKMKEVDPGVHRMSYAELIALGKSPQQILVDLGFLMKDFFQRMGSDHKVAICGHNVFYFDAYILHNTYARTNVPSPLISSMLDTGLLVKAAQLRNPMLEIGPHTQLLDWIREVRNVRTSAKWSLNKFCAPTFNLTSLMPDFVLSMPHSALTDAWSVLALLRLFDS